MLAWFILGLAGLLEVSWAVGLKYTAGFTRLWPSVFTLAALAGSMWLLSVATRTIPLGTAYAVWVGMGAVGAAIFGIAVLREPASTARIACLLLLVVAIVGLKLTAPPPPPTP